MDHLNSKHPNDSYVKRLAKKIKPKHAIPVTAVASSFLFANFAFAKDPLEQGVVGGTSLIVKAGVKLADFFLNFPEYMTKFSYWILESVFTLLTVVGFQTPTWLFRSELTLGLTTKFASLSVIGIIICTMFEGFMRMFNKKHDPLENIIKKVPKAIALSATSPYLFYYGFTLLNKLSAIIASFAGAEISMLSNPERPILSGLNLIGILGFDIALLVLVIPLVIQNAERWWDLLSLIIISPLAFSAAVFERHNHLYEKWWSAVKKRTTTQLVYSVLITILASMVVFVSCMSPKFIIFNALLVIGAIRRLIDPPDIVKQYLGEHYPTNTFKTLFKRTPRELVNLPKDYTMTLGKKKIGEFKASRSPENIMKLRQKHGQRYVKGLK